METPLSFNLIWCFPDRASGAPIMLEVRIHTDGYCRVSLDALHHRIRVEEVDEGRSTSTPRENTRVRPNV